MKMFFPILLLALAPTITDAKPAAAGDTTSQAPLPISECIDTNRINEWHIVDKRHAIVRTGPKRYLVTLKSDCPKLNQPPGLVFSTGPSLQGVTHPRICGAIGETVQSTSQPPCAIESVTIIDKQRFSGSASESLQLQQRPGIPLTLPITLC